MGAFLSNAVYAFVLNRTVFIAHQNMEACFGNIELKRWLPVQSQINTLLQTAGCPLAEHIEYRDGPPCNYSTLNDRLISFDALFNAAYLYLDERYDPYLSEFVKSRSHTLFGNRSNDLGRFSSYGLVAEAIFRFSDNVQAHVADILKASHAISNAVRISIHLRHKDSASLEDPSVDEGFDNNAVQVIEEVRNRHSDSACIVYAAADRNATLDRISRQGARIGCKVYMTEKRVENEVVVINGNVFVSKEHGPWAMGRVQVADIFLLSQGDYLIGTSESTFSALIANHIAWRRVPQDRREYPFFWLDGVHNRNGSFGNYLPHELSLSYDNFNCHAFMNQPYDNK